MIWVIIIASVGGLLLLAIARAPHEDPPPSGNASSADYLEALQKKQKEQNEQKEQETLARKRAEQRSLEDKYANSPLTGRSSRPFAAGQTICRRRSLSTMTVSLAAPTASPGHMTSLQTEWRPSSAYTTACCITETMNFFCARRSLWEMPLIGYWAENTMFRMRRYAEVSSMPILTEKSFFFFTTPPIMFFCG